MIHSLRDDVIHDSFTFFSLFFSRDSWFKILLPLQLWSIYISTSSLRTECPTTPDFGGVSPDFAWEPRIPELKQKSWVLRIWHSKLSGCVRTAPGKFENGVFLFICIKNLRPHGKTGKKIRIHTATMIHWINTWMHLWACTLIAHACCFVCMSKDSSIVLTECRRKGERRTPKLSIKSDYCLWSDDDVQLLLLNAAIDYKASNTIAWTTRSCPKSTSSFRSSW